MRRCPEDVWDSEAPTRRGVRLLQNRVPSPPRDLEAGITALEYALLGSLVALGLILGATAFGKQLREAYDHIGETLESVFGP